MFIHYIQDKDAEKRETDKSYKEFKSAAVVANNEVTCATGKNILAEGGSVVDAAIASMLALGVVSFQSGGIGGGFFMVFFDAESKNDYFFDARETAPLASSSDMYEGNDFAKSLGRSSIAVPGQIKGFWEAHQRFGKLPWSLLFQPAIDLAENGFKMTAGCEHWLKLTMPKIQQNKRLRELLQKNDGKFKQAGDIIFRPKLAKTLRTIAKEGADAYYNGSLTNSILEDINDGFGNPSVITKEDLITYSVRMTEPTKLKLTNDLTLITSGAPSGGPLLAFILNILKGYNINGDVSKENKILLYHRIAEAMKFAYCRKNQLGDPEFSNEVKELIEEMLSDEYCEQVRMKIDDFQTHCSEYYGEYQQAPIDKGTAHVGIVGENGSAVALTGSLNSPFGSNVLGRRTGIIFNNHMENFTSPDNKSASTVDRFVEFFRPFCHISFPAHLISNNLIEPRKRPLSSMTPTIILKNTPNGPEVKMVLGGAGGMRIIASTALTILQSLWFDKNTNDAVKSKRFNNFCFPNILQIENGMDKDIVKGLQEKGHQVEMIDTRLTTMQVISRSNSGTIVAKCDCRKDGYPDGY
ncbi:glutathione hydrolase 1 proenzyme-like isoform X2 [Styela clava]